MLLFSKVTESAGSVSGSAFLFPPQAEVRSRQAASTSGSPILDRFNFIAPPFVYHYVFNLLYVEWSRMEKIGFTL
ncbi:hypothetical protein D3C80_1470520 [compost metagenome]